MRRAKIVCTIGPAVESVEKITELIDAGMNFIPDKEYKTNASLTASPDLTTNVSEHKLYDSVMSHMEGTVTEMHDMVNELKNKSGILEDLIKKLKKAFRVGITGPNH